MTEMPAEQLIRLLNTLLEAERAGAKTLAVFLEEYPPQSPAWRQLRRVQRDEAANCKLLIDAIRSVGGAPSGATGDFLEKAVAVPGRAPRLAFLNRGQAWVARKIAEALPQIGHAPLRRMLQQMHDSHLANIAACDALAAAPADPAT